MKTNPACCSGWCFWSSNFARPEKIVVLLMGAQHLPRLFQSFRFPRLLALGQNGDTVVRYLTCPDSELPLLSPWLQLPLLRRLYARLLLKTVGNTKVLVLIHKKTNHHVAAQLHFAEELLGLGYTHVQIGLTRPEMEALPLIVAHGQRFGPECIVTSEQLKAEHVQVT